MKKLTLTLLLSLTPIGITAGCCDDRAGELNNTEQDERCCGLAELALIDALEAYDANNAYIIVSGDLLSDDAWNTVVNEVSNIFGSPTAQAERSLTYVFNRGNQFVETWFLELAALESKFVELNQIITGASTTTETVLQFGLDL